MTDSELEEIFEIQPPDKSQLQDNPIDQTFFETDGAGIGDLITTRRLTHIVKAVTVFKDRKKAVELCVNRFDADIRDAFIDLYGKIDAGEDLQNEDSGEDTHLSF